MFKCERFDVEAALAEIQRDTPCESGESCESAHNSLKNDDVSKTHVVRIVCESGVKVCESGKRLDTTLIGAPANTPAPAAHTCAVSPTQAHQWYRLTSGAVRCLSCLRTPETAEVPEAAALGCQHRILINDACMDCGEVCEAPVPPAHPLSPTSPCTVCGNDSRWNDHGIWRCKACWPAARLKRRQVKSPTLQAPCPCGATGLTPSAPYDDGSVLFRCTVCQKPRQALTTQQMQTYQEHSDAA
jgi:hypothetical protein